MDIVVRFLRSPSMWVVAAILVVSVVQICFFGRDLMAEVVRRHREPEVEAEVKRRMDTAQVPIAHPGTPAVQMPDLHEWLMSDSETYPVNSFRRMSAIFGVFLIVAVLCATVLNGMYWEWIALGATAIMVTGVIRVGLHKPSLAWRVRREVRIAHVAGQHGAEYVVVDFPGQGWDLTGVKGRVQQVSRDWDTGTTRSAGPSPGDGAVDMPADPQGTASVLDEKPVEVIRSASHPCFEYGMEKLKTNVFRFYVVVETLPLPYVAVRRRTDFPARRRRQVVDGVLVGQSYAVALGCEDAFSRLSHHTRELMADVCVDKMVVDRGWAVLWWDGRIFGGIDFGKGQNWDGRMDMASEKTWDGVKKVRALLSSIENDLTISGSGV